MEKRKQDERKEREVKEAGVDGRWKQGEKRWIQKEGRRGIIAEGTLRRERNGERREECVRGAKVEMKIRRREKRKLRRE